MYQACIFLFVQLIDLEIKMSISAVTNFSGKKQELLNFSYIPFDLRLQRSFGKESSKREHHYHIYLYENYI